MLPKNFFPSAPFILTIIFLLSNHFPVSILCETFQNVEWDFPALCDELGKIEYPFWVDGHQPAGYCGHPAFKLDCWGSKATIEIMNQTYAVISIDYEAQILTIALVLYHVFFGDIVCPERNATMNFFPFEYTSNTQNATLFYECPPEFEHPATWDFPCLKNGVPDHAYVVVNTSLATELLCRCGGGTVVIPVLATTAQGFMNHSLDFHEVLDEGFEVKWTLEEGESRGCAESGGGCGYNWCLDQPSCYCPHKPYSTTCPTLKPLPRIAPTPTALYSPKSSSMFPFPSQYFHLHSFCTAAFVRSKHLQRLKKICFLI